MGRTVVGSGYKVRSKDGGIALEYASLAAVRQAYELALIDPEDEVLEEGKDTWRKAREIPLLSTAIRVKTARRVGSRNQWAFGMAAVGVLTVLLLARGQYVSGGITAFIVVAIGMHLTSLAAEREKKRK